MMGQCIRTAGALYGKDQSEIDGKVVDLDAKFDELLQNTNITYKNAVQYVTNKIERECPSFMLEKYTPLFIVPLPGGLGEIKSSQIFESVNVSVAGENKDDSKKNKNVFSSSKICKQVSNKFGVINGGPGSGKTTLTRNILQSILENSVNGSETSYEDISKFRVPIYLECRTERQNNLRDFLKESFPKLHYSKEVIYDAFKNVTGKVFLIDGYDEVNAKSRELVQDTINFCSNYNATCIVSARVDAGNNFISDLKKKKLSYNDMLIEPINKMNDKLSFLRRYADKMGDVDSVELVKSFGNLNKSAQEVFFCPVLLALFISLFLNHRNSLYQMHNEQSAYKAIREIFSEEIEEKLKESNINNPELKAKYLLEVFSDHSLRQFRNKKYLFEREEFLSLSEDCLRRIPNDDVDFKGLFSCILTPETSMKQTKALTYAFTHSSIQEYMAVGHIMKNMREHKIDWSSEEHSEDSLRKQFLDCLGVSTSLYEVKRYGNIIKLLILETSENEELRKYTRTFTAVLGKYFTLEYGYSPDYLFDLLSSSNCHSAIVSVVATALKDWSLYRICYTRHIRPFAEVLKKKETNIEIKFNFSESLTNTDCVNLGQLVSVLTDEDKIWFNFEYNYNDHQPLNGEFYTKLKNSKCKVTFFRACLTSSEHLSFVMRDYRDEYSLFISTVSVCDVSFATLEKHRGEIDLRVKYTDDCPIAGSNPITRRTDLTITDIPADGKNNTYRIIKFLSPKSKRFSCIHLVNCHLTDANAYNLLKKLKGIKIRTKSGKETEVELMRLYRDKSKDLQLHLKQL